MKEREGRTDGKEEGEMRRGERSLTIEITAKAPRAPPGASQSKSPAGYGNGSQSRTGTKSPEGKKSGGKRKRMAKEAESGGVAKGDERSTKKC